jgi:hypothetical protein
MSAQGENMKKAILLAMAAAIVAMFAVPGSASAAWTKHHQAITQNETLTITGTDISFAGSFGGFDCDTISEVDFTAGTTTGTITTFEPDGTSTDDEVCRGTGGQGHCDVHDFTPHGLPWTIHTVGTNAAGEGTVSVTTGTITTNNTGVFCFSPDLTPGTVHFSGAETTTSTLTLSGTLQSDSPAQTVTVSGQVHILGAETYGV